MPNNAFVVEVQPEYLPEQSVPEADIFRFAYTITITNTGDRPAQLIARHWFISDSKGYTEEVKGLGVVGHQPLLKPGQAFQYSSGCSLRTSSGSMYGSYLCVSDEGETFSAEIPLFVLEAIDPDLPTPPDRILH